MEQETNGQVVVAPQTQETPCRCSAEGASSTPASYVYGLGRIEARFPRLSVEKEYSQVVSQTETAGKNDREVFQEVLSKNRYLARHMCWVFTIQGQETYILSPRDPTDLGQLVGSLRSAPGPNDIDLVIGMRGPIASPEFCNGLMAPIVMFDQLYSFDRNELIKRIPRPEKSGAKEYGPAATQVFDSIMQMTDNAGAMDEHRALNYLAMRDPLIYAKAAEQFANDFSLTHVETRPSLLSGARKIVEVIFSYNNRKTDVAEKFYTRVDVTEEFPFLVSKLAPYVDR